MHRYAILFSFISTCIAASYAQQATGYSSPGRLGHLRAGADTRAPVITLNMPAEAVVSSTTVRDIRVVPDTAATIKIIPDQKGLITLRGTVQDDQRIGSLKINGKAIRLFGGPKQKRFGFRTKAPRDFSTKSLEFVAADAAGNESTRIYQIKRVPGTDHGLVVSLKTKVDRTGSLKSVPLGQYWALVIGINDYPHPSLNSLDYPIEDAQEIAGVLAQEYDFAPERIRILVNPTRADLIAALADYVPQGKTPLDQNDNLLVYYAGHGFWDENYQEGYWLPSDAAEKNRANWVSNSDIQKTFRAIKAQHVLLLSDACFSGSIFATRDPFNAAIEEAYKLPSRKAITAGNFSVVPDRSVFQDYLVRRLQENTYKYLDAGSLYNRIKIAVTNNSPTRQRPIYGTIQDAGDEGGEFIFVRRY